MWLLLFKALRSPENKQFKNILLYLLGKIKTSHTFKKKPMSLSHLLWIAIFISLFFILFLFTMCRIFWVASCCCCYFEGQELKCLGTVFKALPDLVKFIFNALHCGLSSAATMWERIRTVQFLLMQTASCSRTHVRLVHAHSCATAEIYSSSYFAHPVDVIVFVHPQIIKSRTNCS